MRQLRERNYESCLAHAVEFVRSQSQTSEVLIVAATTEAAAEVARLACDTALVGVHAISLRNLARVLAESRLCASGLTPISALGREALIRSITPSVKLGYFAPIAGTPGFARAAARTLRDLRMNDVQPEGDLQVLMDAYRSKLKHENFADVAMEFEFAASEQEHPFCEMPVVFLDVPVPYTLEKRLVQRLCRKGLVLTRTDEFAPPNATMFSASSEALECVEIARRCLTSGLPFDRIAVLARDASRVQPLLEEAFDRAGVPAYFTRGCLRPSSAGRAMLALLQSAAEGFSIRRLKEFESLGQSSNVKPLPLLQALPTGAPWSDWLDALAELSRCLRIPDRVLELLDQLAPLADVGPVTLQEVILLVQPHLRTLRDPAEGSRYGKVFVGPIEDARGLSFDCVFLPGLCEGSFPKPFRQDPLLPAQETDEESERDLLRQAAACATGQFVGSYSRVDLATGRARVPSLYAYDVLRAALGRPPEAADFDASHVQTTLAWPAPQEIADAVDDTEYDLALLREPVGASAAYITKINPLAADVLRQRWRRWHTAWHAADGRFEEIDFSLTEKRLTHEAYSPTDLQKYAQCPYRFYLRSIIELKPFEQPEAPQRMEPSVRGNIFHRVTERVMTAEGQVSFEELDAVLEKIAAEEADMWSPAIEEVRRQELGRLRADLRGWLSEYHVTSQEWKPIKVEEDFEAVLFDRFKVKGRIDVVEQHVSGLRRIIDHKTGTPPKDKISSIGKGEVLQPVLYGLAEQVTKSQLYFATLRGNYQRMEIAVNEEASRVAERVLTNIDEAIDAGEFPAYPRLDACEFCEFTPVCGPYEEERASRKPKLRRVEEIRRIP
ncbi:MAG TPA: PD-(D/E)XK nuclease family protein [Bryobacteraceae bacterium]|nr:PD-(D/E)XK nuclease family protein [Bryobacteraceae bacterium]